MPTKEDYITWREQVLKNYDTIIHMREMGHESKVIAMKLGIPHQQFISVFGKVEHEKLAQAKENYRLSKQTLYDQYPLTES